MWGIKPILWFQDWLCDVSFTGIPEKRGNRASLWHCPPALPPQTPASQGSNSSFQAGNVVFVGLPTLQTTPRGTSSQSALSPILLLTRIRLRDGKGLSRGHTIREQLGPMRPPISPGETHEAQRGMVLTSDMLSTGSEASVFLPTLLC